MVTIPLSAQRYIHDALDRGLCVPVIGAGTSIPVGGLGWNNYLRQLLLDLPPEAGKLANDPDNPLDSADYIRSLRQLFHLEPIQTTVFNHSAVHEGMARLNCSLYVTTNYDDSIERALSSVGRQPMVKCYDQLGQFDLLSPSRAPIVVKLCSHSSNPNPGALTRRDFAKLLYQSRVPQEFLVTLLRTRVLLFIGCSLQDPIIASALDRCFGDEIGRPKHFAFLSDTTAESTIQTLKELGVDILRMPRDQITPSISSTLATFPQIPSNRGRLLVIESPLPTRAVKILETLITLRINDKVPAITFITDSPHRSNELKEIRLHFPTLDIQIEQVKDLHDGLTTRDHVLRKYADATYILAPSEYSVSPAAKFAKFWMGSGQNPLQYHSESTANLSRNKTSFRQFLSENFKDHPSIGTPRFCELDCSELTAAELYTKILQEFARWPDIDEVVLKPIDGAGSLGVRPVKLKSDENFARQVVTEFLSILKAMPCDAETERNITNKVLIEQRIFGEEFSVESRRSFGNIETLAIHWKIDIDGDPLRFFERTFVTLSPEREEYACLSRVNVELLSEMGVSDGVFHSEYRLCNESGKIFPLEIALRQGGGMVGFSVAASTGVNLFESAIRGAIRSPQVPFEINNSRIVSTGLIFAERPGVLPPLSVVDNGERKAIRLNDTLGLSEWLNSKLRSHPRAAALSDFSTGPGNAKLRRDAFLSFSPNSLDGRIAGLDATVEQIHIWMSPGQAIAEEETTYVAGLLIRADDKLGNGMKATAEAVAAMQMCLGQIQCEPLPALLPALWNVHRNTNKAAWFVSTNNHRGGFRSDDDSWTFALAIQEALSHNMGDPIQIVDLGCGAINPVVGILAAAADYKVTTYTGLDTDQDELSLARSNIGIHQLHAVATVLSADVKLYDPIAIIKSQNLGFGRFIVCANLPYLPTDPQVGNRERHVDGGKDGLEYLPHDVLRFANALQADYCVINISSLANVEAMLSACWRSGFGVVDTIATVAPLEKYALSRLSYLKTRPWSNTAIFGEDGQLRQIIFGFVLGKARGVNGSLILQEAASILQPDRRPLGSVFLARSQWVRPHCDV
ncbi:MAG: ATP-grasp domain-containing protein [Sphingobacteriales bacterium]|nr:MAG: ATP-grasp domain-containing protein [Sphingobacteriales bacterium]